MAIKKFGISENVMGRELKKLLRAVEQEDRNSLTLGETAAPLLDLYETADMIVVEADMPGVDPQEVDISILHGVLTIEGVKKEKVEDQCRVNYLCMERSFDTFKRILKINAPVNARNATATYSRGVLTVSFPKVADKRGEPIVIPVKRTDK